MDLTVILATIPERRQLRTEAVRSVEVQTVTPRWLLVEEDVNHCGPAWTFNRLAERVSTEWLFPFADDDLLDPNHFEVLAPHLTAEWDVVYSWPRLTGRDIPPDLFQREEPFENLRDHNWISGSACIRSSLWRQLGGYRTVFHEDHDLWKRALDVGARFKCVPRVTWTYRTDSDWWHVSDGRP